MKNNRGKGKGGVKWTKMVVGGVGKMGSGSWRLQMANEMKHGAEFQQGKERKMVGKSAMASYHQTMGGGSMHHQKANMSSFTCPSRTSISRPRLFVHLLTSLFPTFFFTTHLHLSPSQLSFV